MKILLFPLLLFSAALTAQKKEELKFIPKTDTAKILEKKGQLPVNFGMNPAGLYKELYKMMTIKPKDTIYMALKEPKKDDSKYKILNAITLKNQK
ncbi:MAG: hypothetical protein MUW56_20710 [Chryseobacterium sp.]|uniref:hypothetical protein n=1 Tax=Chryseobacterium sp. TaxID=1871047 RepID=UPI0025BDEC89|nr:hypothetical protein [Chryseobacterium sp.]MCJ7935979.1 hypothetical protein [Chryseobacterium sp.]